MTWVVLGSFFVLGLVCLFTIGLGLPGTWILLCGAVLIELFDTAWLPEGLSVTFGWWPIALGLVMAVVGEAIELVSGMLGAKKGGTRRGAIGAFLGGLLGALLMAIVIPVVGGLIGAIVGTFVGALTGELTGPNAQEMKTAWKPAVWATVARVFGLCVKMAIGFAVLTMLCLSALRFLI